MLYQIVLRTVFSWEFKRHMRQFHLVLEAAWQAGDCYCWGLLLLLLLLSSVPPSGGSVLCACFQEASVRPDQGLHFFPALRCSCRSCFSFRFHVLSRNWGAGQFYLVAVATKPRKVKAEVVCLPAWFNAVRHATYSAAIFHLGSMYLLKTKVHGEISLWGSSVLVLAHKWKVINVVLWLLECGPSQCPWVPGSHLLDGCCAYQQWAHYLFQQRRIWCPKMFLALQKLHLSALNWNQEHFVPWSCSIPQFAACSIAEYFYMNRCILLTVLE